LSKLIRISENSFFKGSYSGSEDIELFGVFEGSLIIKNLFIKKTGLFKGYLSAENIIVDGEITANIETESLHLKATGIVDGDVFYRNIIIDSGGTLKSQMVQNISKIDNLIKLTRN
tara:strand:+ start:755 stop:1102 length:348 start_codon:yes stop_codon:yes gene_type:complete